MRHSIFGALLALWPIGGTCLASPAPDAQVHATPVLTSTPADAAPAAAAAPATVKEAGPTTPIDWVSLPGGAFQMGADDSLPNETPRRRVTVAPFQLMKAEVTNAQYAQCVAAGACSAAGYRRCSLWDYDARETYEGAVKKRSPLRRPEHPVVCVDWAQASAFARWAGARLPTEAEWEFAARSGGREQRYPWGDAAPTCDLTQFDPGGPNDSGDGCGTKVSVSVCSKPGGHSAQGVCDLAGNAWEWVADNYGPYAEAPSDGSARSAPAKHRVFRGGSWLNLATDLRAAVRYDAKPDYRARSLGFRLAR